jgi:hypothetical protein
MMIFECPVCGDGSLGYRDDGKGHYIVPVCEHGCSIPETEANELKSIAEIQSVRDTTKRLINSVVMDMPMESLTAGVLVDFEIRDREDWTRLYYYIKSPHFSPLALDAAMNDRAKIEALVNV